MPLSVPLNPDAVQMYPYAPKKQKPALGGLLRTISLHTEVCGNMHLVRQRGLEPPRLAAPEPKSGVYTNFTTGAMKAANYTEFAAFLATPSAMKSNSNSD